MALRYEIDKNNYVMIFENESQVPFLLQPNYPNGGEWESAEEAKAWAELYIESIENKDAPYAPSERGLAGRPKLTE